MGIVRLYTLTTATDEFQLALSVAVVMKTQYYLLSDFAREIKTPIPIPTVEIIAPIKIILKSGILIFEKEFEIILARL